MYQIHLHFTCHAIVLIFLAFTCSNPVLRTHSILLLDLPTSRAQIFSLARGASGMIFYVFCGKSERESGSSTCFPCKKSHQVTSFCRELFASLSRVFSRVCVVASCQSMSKQVRTMNRNLDQNISSHVTYGVIGFDWRRISKTVRDWIKPFGRKIPAVNFGAPQLIKVLRAGANYRIRKWEAKDFEKIYLSLKVEISSLPWTWEIWVRD